MPKQVIVHPSIEAVSFIDAPIPVPKDREIVIKVVIAGSNPKDFKYPMWKDWPHNSGDDLAGIVHSVGKDVYEFKVGDHVASYHPSFADNGSYAEYSVCVDWTTLHIPANVPLEGAATVPLAALTAATALFSDMKLPAPYDVSAVAKTKGLKTAIVIYGVTSAVGAFAAKLVRLSGLYPIIGIAGRASDYAQTLVDYVVDYRNGEDAVVASIESILAEECLGPKVPYVLDAISEDGTLEATLRFLDHNGGTVSTVLPPSLFAKSKDKFTYPDGVTAVHTAVPVVHSTQKDFGYIWSRYLSRLLEDGRLTVHPYEVIPGGLDGILQGLQNLKDGKASAVKYVYRIDETPDVPTVPAEEIPGLRRYANGDEDAENTRALTADNVQKIHGHGTHPLKDFPVASNLE